jgi:hypothetical protein
MPLVVILLMAIDGYSIGGLLIIILLMVIGDYFIIKYCWILQDILSYAISSYFTLDHYILF